MSVAATIHLGTLPIILAGPRPSYGPRGSLDSLSFELLTSLDNWQTDASTIGFEYEQPVAGYAGMWVQSLAVEGESDLTASVRVECVGLIAAGDKRKRTLSVAGRQIAVGPSELVVLAWTDDEQGEETTGDPLPQVKRRVPKLDDEGEPVYKTITVPGGTHDRFNVREAILVLTDTYFTTTKPDTTVIGTALVPPNAPETPEYIWGGYTEPMRANYPNGWVLDDRQVEEHFRIDDSMGLWEVTDSTGFYQIAVPD